MVQFDMDKEFLSSSNSPEKSLAVAVLQRAITDACSPTGISDNDRKSALDFLFLETGREWGYSLENIAGYLSEESDAMVTAIRNYVIRAREHYEKEGAYSQKSNPGKRPWVPIPLECLDIKDFRERPESLLAGCRRVAQ